MNAGVEIFLVNTVQLLRETAIGLVVEILNRCAEGPGEIASIPQVTGFFSNPIIIIPDSLRHTFSLHILFLFENGKPVAASSEWNFHF